jgi:hypothetical protein
VSYLCCGKYSELLETVLPLAGLVLLQLVAEQQEAHGQHNRRVVVEHEAENVRPVKLVPAQHVDAANHGGVVFFIVTKKSVNQELNELLSGNKVLTEFLSVRTRKRRRRWERRGRGRAAT